MSGVIAPIFLAILIFDCMYNLDIDAWWMNRAAAQSTTAFTWPIKAQAFVFLRGKKHI